MKIKSDEKNTVAYEALQQIKAIYKLDNDLSQYSTTERHEQRQLIVKPLVEAFFAWVKQKQIDTTILP